MGGWWRPSAPKKIGSVPSPPPPTAVLVVYWKALAMVDREKKSNDIYGNVCIRPICSTRNRGKIRKTGGDTAVERHQIRCCNVIWLCCHMLWQSAGRAQTKKGCPDVLEYFPEKIGAIRPAVGKRFADLCNVPAGEHLLWHKLWHGQWPCMIRISVKCFNYCYKVKLKWNKMVFGCIWFAQKDLGWYYEMGGFDISKVMY